MKLYPNSTLSEYEWDSGSIKAFIGKCGNTYLALVQASEVVDGKIRQFLAPYAESTEYDTIRDIVFELNYGNVEA